MASPLSLALSASPLNGRLRSALPLLEAIVARLIGRVAARQICPRRAGAQDPKDAAAIDYGWYIHEEKHDVVFIQMAVVIRIARTFQRDVRQISRDTATRSPSGRVGEIVTRVVVISEDVAGKRVLKSPDVGVARTKARATATQAR